MFAHDFQSIRRFAERDHATIVSWNTYDPVPSPLPIGPLSAEVAAGACALDAAVHAWDIAVATGQPSPLPDELAEALLAVAKEIPSGRPDLGNAVRLARDSAPGGQCRSTAKMRVRPVIRDR
jgi:hypothetical protein